MLVQYQNVKRRPSCRSRASGFLNLGNIVFSLTYQTPPKHDDYGHKQYNRYLLKHPLLAFHITSIAKLRGLAKH